MRSATPTDPGATPSRAILLLALASFVGAANLRVCDALLPQIAAELGVTVGSAAAMVTAFAGRIVSASRLDPRKRGIA